MGTETTTPSENPKPGRAWTNHKHYLTYKEADDKRNELIQETKLQVKVKRRGDGRFVVKTRKVEDEKPKKEPKRRKG